MAKTGHLVGVDPATGRVVVLRKGMDGKAVRQVDVLTFDEARDLRRQLMAALSGGSTDTVREIPTPEQVTLDLFDTTNDPERITP